MYTYKVWCMVIKCCMFTNIFTNIHRSAQNLPELYNQRVFVRMR